MAASLLLVAGLVTIVAANGYADQALALAAVVVVLLAAAIAAELFFEGRDARRDAARRNQAWRVR